MKQHQRPALRIVAGCKKNVSGMPPSLLDFHQFFTGKVNALGASVAGHAIACLLRLLA
jgi:hypothetical protein